MPSGCRPRAPHHVGRRLREVPRDSRRVELDLVDDRRHGRVGNDLIELVWVEVRHADRSGVAALASGLHPGPGPGRPTFRPVNDVQVDVVDAEPLDARAASLSGSRRPGWNFVVMNTSSRAMPLSRSARPTLDSFPYACAVSMWRYPTSSAARTACAHSGPSGTCHTPSPSSGITVPSARTRPRPSGVSEPIDGDADIPSRPRRAPPGP